MPDEFDKMNNEELISVIQIFCDKKNAKQKIIEDAEYRVYLLALARKLKSEENIISYV